MPFGIDFAWLAGDRRVARWHSTYRARERGTGDAHKEEVDLGRCGAVTLHPSNDEGRVLLEFEAEPEGPRKNGINGFIDALKQVRERMRF